MTTEARIQNLLQADAEKLAQVDSILEGRATEATNTDRRLLSMTQAAETMGLSRQTIWRMIKEDRLPVVEIRRGRYRVPSAAITAMLKEVSI